MYSTKSLQNSIEELVYNCEGEYVIFSIFFLSFIWTI